MAMEKLDAVADKLLARQDVLLEELQELKNKKQEISNLFDSIKLNGKKIDFEITNSKALQYKIVKIFTNIIENANGKIQEAMDFDINLDNISVNGIETSIETVLQKVVDSIRLNGNTFNEALILELSDNLKIVEQMTQEITNRINGYNINDFINNIQKINGIEFVSQKTIDQYKKRISNLTITTEKAVDDINKSVLSSLKFNRYQQTILSAINQNDISMLYDINHDDLGYDRLSKMYQDLYTLTENNSLNKVDDEISSYLINLKNSISQRIDYLDRASDNFIEDVWNNPLYEKYQDVSSISEEYNYLTNQIRNGWISSSDALSRMNVLLKDYDDNFDPGKIQERVNIINELNDALNSVKEILSSATNGGFRENNNITESLNSISDSIDRLQEVFTSINVDEFTESLRSCFNMLNEFFNLLKTKDGSSNIFSDYITSFDSIINKLEIIQQKVGKSQFNYTYRQESNPNELAQKNKYNTVLSTELERYKSVYSNIIDKTGFENLIYELITYSNSFKAQFEGNTQEAMDLFNIKSILDIQSTEAGALGSIQRIIDFLKYIDEALSNVAQIKTKREDVANKIKNAKTPEEKNELNKLYDYLPNINDFWDEIFNALKNKAGQNRVGLNVNRITASLNDVAGGAENNDQKENKIFKALERHEKKLNKIDQENTPESKYLEKLEDIQKILQNIADVLNSNLSQNVIGVENVENNQEQINDTFQNATKLLAIINEISEKIQQMPDLNLFQNINTEEILTSVVSLIDEINSSLDFDEIIQKVQICVNKINDILDQVKPSIENIHNLIDNIPEEKNILIKLDLNQLQSDIDNYFNIIKTMGDIPIAFNIGNNEVRTQANVLDPDDIKALEIIAKAIQDIPDIFKILYQDGTNGRVIQQLIKKGWKASEVADFDEALIKTGFMDRNTMSMTFKNITEGAQHKLGVIGDKYVILGRGNNQEQRFDQAVSNQKIINDLVAEGFNIAAMALVKKMNDNYPDSTKEFIEIQQRLPGENHRKVIRNDPAALINMPVENLAELFRQFNVILQRGLTGEFGGDNLLYSNSKLFPIDLIAPGTYMSAAKDIEDFKKKLYFSFSHEFSSQKDQDAFEKKIDEAYELFKQNPEPTFYKNKDLTGLEILLTPELIEQWRQKIQQDLNKESLKINISPILSDSFKSDIEKQLKGLNIGISLNPSGAFKNNSNKQNNNNIPSGIMLDENEFELPHIPTFADWILDHNLSGFTQEEKDFYEATGDISPKILQPIIEALEMGVIDFKEAYKELNLIQPTLNQSQTLNEDAINENTKAINENTSEFLHVISTMNMGDLRNFTYEDNHLGRKIKVNGQINEQTGDFEETSRIISTNYKLIVSEAAKAQIEIEKINTKLANETDDGIRQALENVKSIYQENFNNAVAAAKFYANEISFNPLNAEFINDPNFYSQFLLDTFYQDVLKQVNPLLGKENVKREQNRAKKDADIAVQEQMAMEAESEELAAQRKARYDNLIKAQKEAHDMVQAYKENEQINDKNKLFDAQKLKSLQSVLQYLDEIEIGNVSTQTLDQLTNFFDLIKNAQNAIQLKTVNTEFDIFKNNNTTNFKPDIIQNKKNELSQAVKEYEIEIINAKKNTIGFNIAIKNITELINGITASDGITYAKQEFEKLKQNFPINNDQNFDLIKQVTDLYKYATNDDVRNEISLLLNEVAKATNETQINLVKENINNLKGKLLSDENITKQLHGEKEQAVINKLIEIKKLQDDKLISEHAGEDTQEIENIIEELEKDLTELQKEYDNFVKELKDFYPGNASIFDGVSSSNIRIPQKEQEKLIDRYFEKQKLIAQKNKAIQEVSTFLSEINIEKIPEEINESLHGFINSIKKAKNETELKLINMNFNAFKKENDQHYKSTEKENNLLLKASELFKYADTQEIRDKIQDYIKNINDAVNNAQLQIIEESLDKFKSELLVNKNVPDQLTIEEKKKIIDQLINIKQLEADKEILEFKGEDTSKIDENIKQAYEILENLEKEYNQLIQQLSETYNEFNLIFTKFSQISVPKTDQEKIEKRVISEKSKIKQQRVDTERKQNSSLAKRNRRIDLLDRLKLKYTNDVDRPLNQGQINNINAIVNGAKGQIQRIFGSAENGILTDKDVAAIDNITKETVLRVKQFMDGIYKSMEQAPVNLSAQIEKIRKMITDLSKLDKEDHYEEEIKDLYDEAMADIDAKTVKIIKNKVESLKSKLYSEKNITGLLSDSKNKIIDSRNKIYELNSQKEVAELIDPKSVSKIDEQIQKEEENLRNLKSELLGLAHEILMVYKEINPDTKIENDIDRFISEDNDIPDIKNKENIDKKKKTELDKEANKAYKENLKIIEEIIDIYPDYISKIKEFDEENTKLFNDFVKIQNQIENNNGLFQYGDNDLRQQFLDKYNNFNENIKGNLLNKKNNINDYLQNILDNKDSSKQLILIMENYQKQLENIKFPNIIDDDWIKNNYDNFIKLIDEIQSTDIKPFQRADVDQINTLRSSVSQFLHDNSAMSKNNKSELLNILDKLKAQINELTNDDLKKLESSFKKVRADVYELGQTGQSAFDKLKNNIRNIFGDIVTRYLSINDWIRYIRDGSQAVIDLDNALVELKIISNAQSTILSDVSQKAYELGNNIGFSTSEIIKSITEWKRLGNTMNDSILLAEQAGRLATGGLMDVSTATSVLTSSMQAFKIEAKDLNKVIDQYIYLGNNYAITSEDLATSLTKSIAALKVAGNNLEQVEALEVAGNTIMQDADTVSNALKVVSMRLRGTAGSALEEIGEETDGLIENSSKLEKKVKSLTKTMSSPDGISIINKINNSYKSTYQILLEISKVWNQIGDAQKSELLEIIAGKTRGSVVASLLESGDILESAYNDAVNNSAGAGEKAIENSLTASEKKIQILQNTLKYAAQQLIDSDMLKSLIDGLNELVELFVKLSQSINPFISLFGNLTSEVLKFINILPGDLASFGILGIILGGKNKDKFKNYKKEITSLSSSINTIFDNISFDSLQDLPHDVLDQYKLQLSKATIQEQKMAIASSNLTKSQKKLLSQYLKNIEGIKSLNGLELKNILNSTIQSEQTKEQIMQQTGLSLANNDVYLSEKALNSEKIIEILNNSALEQEEKNLAIQQIQNIATNKAESVSIKDLIRQKEKQVAVDAKYIVGLLKEHWIIALLVVVVTALVKIFNKASEEEEEHNRLLDESVDKLNDSVNSFKELSQSIDDHIETLQKYSSILKDNISKESMSQEVKEELYNVQEDIINQFGSMSEGIDLINGKYEDQIELLKNIKKESIGNFLTEELGNYKNNIEKLQNVQAQLFVGTDMFMGGQGATFGLNIIQPETNSKFEKLSNQLSKFNIISSTSGGAGIIFKYKGSDFNGDLDFSNSQDPGQEYSQFYQDILDFENWYRDLSNIDEFEQPILQDIHNSIQKFLNSSEFDKEAFEKAVKATNEYEKIAAQYSGKQVQTLAGETKTIADLYADYVNSYNEYLSNPLSNIAKMNFDNAGLEKQLSTNIINTLDSAIIRAFNDIKNDGEKIVQKKNPINDILDNMASDAIKNGKISPKYRLWNIVEKYQISTQEELKQLEKQWIFSGYDIDKLETLLNQEQEDVEKISRLDFLNKTSTVKKPNEKDNLIYDDVINSVIEQIKSAQELISNSDLSDDQLWGEALSSLFNKEDITGIQIDDFSELNGTVKSKITSYVKSLSNWLLEFLKTSPEWSDLSTETQNIISDQINSATYSALAGGEDWKNYQADLDKINFLFPYLEMAKNKTALTDAEAQLLFDQYSLKTSKAGTDRNFLNTDDIVSKYNEIVNAANTAAIQIRRAEKALQMQDLNEQLSIYAESAPDSFDQARKIYSEQGEDALRSFVASFDHFVASSDYSTSFSHINVDKLIQLFEAEKVGEIVGDSIAEAMIDEFDNSVLKSNWESKSGTIQGLLERLIIGNDDVTKQEIIDTLPDFEEFYNTNESIFITDENLTESEKLFTMLFAYIRSGTLDTLAMMQDESYETFSYMLEEQNEFLKGSNKVDTLVDSYYDLSDVLDKVKNGYVFNQDEIDALGAKYPELLNIINVVSDGYKLTEDTVKDLIQTYGEEANAAINSQLNVANATIDYCKAQINAFEDLTEAIDIVRNAYNNMGIASTLALAYGSGLITQEQTAKIYEAWVANGRTLEALQQAAYGTNLGFALEMFDSENYINTYKNTFKDIAGNLEKLRDEEGTEIDWLNQKIQHFQDNLDDATAAYDNLITKVSSTNKATSTFYDDQIALLQKQKNALEDLRDTYVIAEQEYLSRYQNTISKYGINSTIQKAIEDGTQQKIVKYSPDQKEFAEGINKAIDYWNSMRDAQKQQVEYNAKIASVDTTALDNAMQGIAERFERALNRIDFDKSVLEKKLDITTSRGFMANSNYYKTLIVSETAAYEANQKQYEELIKQYEVYKDISDVTKEMGDKYEELKTKIQDVTISMYENISSLISYQNELRQLRWDVREREMNIYSSIVDESNFYIDELSRNADKLYTSTREMLYGDNFTTRLFDSSLTSEGEAVLGLHMANMKLYKKSANEYEKDIKEINEQIAQSGNEANVELLDKRNELIQSYRDSIKSMNDEKQAIIDLVREGYDKQIESLQTLIDKYMEAKNAEKDMYSYEEDMRKKTKDLTNLRKQMAAYVNDTSEEARMKVQQLQVQIEDAEKDIRDTEQDKYLDEQQKMLDNLYNQYEAFVDEKFENEEKILKQLYKEVKQNSSEITETLGSDNTGLPGISKTLSNIFNMTIGGGKTVGAAIDESENHLNAIKASVSEIPENIKSILKYYGINPEDLTDTTLTELISSLLSEVDSTVDLTFFDGDEWSTNKLLGEIRDDVRKLIPSSTPDGRIGLPQAPATAPSSYKIGKDTYTVDQLKTMNVSDIAKKYSEKELNQFITANGLSGVGYQFDTESGKWFVRNTKEDIETKKYSTREEALAAYIKKYYKKNAYAVGNKKVKDEELAWTQEKGMEAIIRPTDNAILTPLKSGDSVLTANATKNIWDMANNPYKFIKDNLSASIDGANILLTAGSRNVNTNVAMSITLPSVQNYNEFVSSLQKDKKFQSMIQDMTVNQMMGGNSLAKNKYKF